ncbi:hypothetical protein KL930_000338 [Ogataea haglerorum]|uniref:TLC domain-containing protein n=1 Tax=Ogataea haglerorum TaxID=1937702 RepID=A0AAN6I039_9ASCO|nr:uncharacterized protein KL911_000793 [Ogataea haglerorum]KAG7697607.1 hypothetical protein KL951_002181 [Ogataea haglerorum]KAG7701208.1 hypothetical protein KL915_000239 [Ogataea haglerorum]KAG7705885.1 hypothetical protein KL950_003461 [Ogataea haglerorum]KAG7709166.1 hypothetical protein KL914_001556 [Ogataea haglerorum]KAG7715294.1 hypothetical protein KL913_004126 [Ogataea haglerorum]
MTVESLPSATSSAFNLGRTTLKSRSSFKSGLKNPAASETPDSQAAKLKDDGYRLAKLENADKLLIQMVVLIDIAIFGLSYYYPWFSKFYTLQYRYPHSDFYDMGIDDSYFLIFSVLNLVLIRSFCMLYILKPIARSFQMYKLKAIQRFKEQGWSFIYFSLSWSFGFHLYLHSDYYLDCDKFYESWPNDKMSASFKAYYLIQTACWLQQMIVLHIEEKRKDHYQMFSHHIITSLLCIGSYAYYFTKIGHVIFLLMDIVDVFLSFAKILKYCGYQTFCDIMFAVFMISYIALRHVVYNYLFYHAYKNAYKMHGTCEELAPLGDYKICYSNATVNIFLSLLGGLQLITIFWMFLIAKVAYRVISGDSADDVRSDDSD